MPPDKALRYMLARSGKIYDPIIMKLFINCIGIYPIGTLLLLDTRELSVVIENNPDPEKWNAPRVKLIADSQGCERSAELIDLADPRCARTVTEVLDPYIFRIDVSQYVI